MRHRTRALAAGTVALLAAPAPWTATVAGAAGTPAGRPIAAGAPGATAGFASAATIARSTAFAGYVTEPKSVTSLTTTVTVPLITRCARTAKDSGFGPAVFAFGKSGFSVGAGAEASCQAGVTAYLVAIVFNGAEKKFITVKPKASLTVTITATSKATSVVIVDHTSRQRVAESGPKATLTAGEVGDDTLQAGGVELPIPPFTRHAFAACRVDGKNLGTTRPTTLELVKGSTVLIAPGPLTAKGSAFVMRFEHAG